MCCEVGVGWKKNVEKLVCEREMVGWKQNNEIVNIRCEKKKFSLVISSLIKTNKNNFLSFIKIQCS